MEKHHWREFPHGPGIYRILNTKNGWVYVGASQYVNERVSMHASQLRKGKHGNRQLQKDWKLFGASAFEFKLIREIKQPSRLRTSEAAAIKRLGRKHQLYNRISTSTYQYTSPKELKRQAKINRTYERIEINLHRKASRAARRMGYPFLSDYIEEKLKELVRVARKGYHNSPIFTTYSGA